MEEGPPIVFDSLYLDALVGFHALFWATVGCLPVVSLLHSVVMHRASLSLSLALKMAAASGGSAK